MQHRKEGYIPDLTGIAQPPSGSKTDIAYARAITHELTQLAERYGDLFDSNIAVLVATPATHTDTDTDTDTLTDGSLAGHLQRIIRDNTS